MACNLLSLASPQPPHFHLRRIPLNSSPLPTPTNYLPSLRTRRGDLAVAKAGPPSSNSLILAFVLPLSLLAGTVFASIRIADQLEEKFLEDLAMNKAMMEENEEGEGDNGEETVFMDEDGAMFMEEDVAAAAAEAPRVRNRPRKEA